MARQYDRTGIRLPKNSSDCVRSAVVHVISLARFALLAAENCANRGRSAKPHRPSQCSRLKQEIALLREELRIKDGRMGRIAPHRRPHYTPTERMAIMELRAARGWSGDQTAQAFLLSPPTVASWMTRIDEQGSHALVQTCEPVNRFPDFVRYLVQRLKTLCPALGKVKIAQILARAGLHLASSTVGRILHEKPMKPPTASTKEESATDRVVTAKSPNHVCHVDLTTVPIWSVSGLRGFRLHCRSAGRSVGGWPWSLITIHAVSWVSPSFANSRTRKPFACPSTAPSERFAPSPSISSATKAASSGVRASRLGADTKRSGRDLAPWGSTAA